MGSLLLFVKGGAHGWRFDYRFGGKRNMLSFGTYPDTTLAIARRKADAVRQLLAEGFDPSQKRKAERESFENARVADERKAQGLPPLGSFEAIAREWFAVKRDGWAASYAGKIIARFEADVFPWIGKQPIGSITPPQLLEVLRRIEARGVVETAHRALHEVTGHGFRATARTMLQERLGFDPHVIEAQLAHSVRDSLGRANNRTEFVEQRRKMLQAWADYLDKLRRGAPVVQISRRKA